jgi:putative restriction endonuclease
MAFGVFIHRADSIYDDKPAERYQFPAQYLSRARNFEGSWILYYEPKKATKSRGYFAVARVQEIIPDPTTPSMYLAVIEAGSYLEFPHPVPFSDGNGLREVGLLNADGRISGRAQSAVRPISSEDFNRILDAGIADAGDILARDREDDTIPLLRDPDATFDHGLPRNRMTYYGSRIVRNRVFRKVVLRAYDSRCALTGLKLINGGGRAEVEAAHIKPVGSDGPDIINNGLALSGTVHWMFDRGLIGLGDDLEILISRYVNDRDSVAGLLNRSGYAHLPERALDRPHPLYLRWHRDNCFKQ